MLFKLKIFVGLLFLVAVSTCKTSSDVATSKSGKESNDKMAADFDKALNAVDGSGYTDRAKRLEARDRLARENIVKSDKKIAFITSQNGAMRRQAPAGEISVFDNASSNQDVKPSISIKGWNFTANSMEWTKSNYVNNMKDVLVGTIKGPVGAKRLALAFESVNIESYFDQIRLVDSSGKVCDILSGIHPEGFVSSFCEGNIIKIQASTDRDVAGYEGGGFKLAGFYSENSEGLSLSSTGSHG